MTEKSHLDLSSWSRTTVVRPNLSGGVERWPGLAKGARSGMSLPRGSSHFRRKSPHEMNILLLTCSEKHMVISVKYLNSYKFDLNQSVVKLAVNQTVKFHSFYATMLSKCHDDSC